MMKLGEGWVVTKTFDAWQIRHDKLDAKSSPIKDTTILTIIKGPSTISPDPATAFFSVDSYHQYRAFEKTIREHCKPYPAPEI